MRLTEQQRGFLKLVERSMKGTEWAKVSEMLTHFVKTEADVLPELVETKTESGIFYIKLTNKGSTVIDYL